MVAVGIVQQALCRLLGCSQWLLLPTEPPPLPSLPSAALHPPHFTPLAYPSALHTRPRLLPAAMNARYPVPQDPSVINTHPNFAASYLDVKGIKIERFINEDWVRGSCVYRGG